MVASGKSFVIENFMRSEQRVIRSTMDAQAKATRISPRLAAYDEIWMQKLISDYPELIEVGDVLRDLSPLTREFSLQSGRIDNIFVRADGCFVLVEVKLWRNNESKNAVTRQIRRYQSEFSCLSVKEILKRVKPSGAHSDAALRRLNERLKNIDVTASDFGVTIAIVSDHIREQLRRSANERPKEPEISVELVQLNFEELNDSVVVIRPERVSQSAIEQNAAEYSASGLRSPVEAMNLDMFYKNVSIANPGNVTTIQEFLCCIDGMGFSLHFSGRNLIVRTEFEPGVPKSILSFYPKHIEFWQFSQVSQSSAWRTLSQDYLYAVRQLVPGSDISVHKLDIDLKLHKKYMPIEATQSHISDIAGLFIKAVEQGRHIAQTPSSGVDGAAEPLAARRI